MLQEREPTESHCPRGEKGCHTAATARERGGWPRKGGESRLSRGEKDLSSNNPKEGGVEPYLYLYALGRETFERGKGKGEREGPPSWPTPEGERGPCRFGKKVNISVSKSRKKDAGRKKKGKGGKTRMLNIGEPTTIRRMERKVTSSRHRKGTLSSQKKSPDQPRRTGRKGGRRRRKKKKRKAAS